MTTKKADEKPRQQKLKKPPKWIEVIDNELIKSEAGSAETKGVSGHDTEKEAVSPIKSEVERAFNRTSPQGKGQPSEMSGKKLYLVDGSFLQKKDFMKEFDKIYLKIFDIKEADAPNFRQAQCYKMLQTMLTTLIEKNSTEITPSELEALKICIKCDLEDVRGKPIEKDVYYFIMKNILKKLEGLNV